MFGPRRGEVMSGLRWSLRVGAWLLLGLFSPAEGQSVEWQTLELPDQGTYARWYLPVSAPSGASLPIVVFLHGAGSTPEAWMPLLQGEAERTGALFLLPKSISDHGWGIGRDQDSIRLALEQLGGSVALDRLRVGLAGHSSGGSFAYVAGLGAGLKVAGVFSLAAPYRTVLEGDGYYRPPLRLYYGTQDPNYAVLSPLTEMMGRLGVSVQVEIGQGYGHSSWPTSTLGSGIDFLLDQRYPGPCEPTDTRLCLGKGRFAAEVEWRDHADQEGRGVAVAGETVDSGLFWFFGKDNWELMVKVIDGCSFNGYYWVFGAAATDVEYRLSVVDLATGARTEYLNPRGQRSAAIADTSALATCP